MRYFKYAIRTELSYKTGFIINLTVSVLVIYFILQFFGAYKATTRNMFEGNVALTVSAEVNETLPAESYLSLRDLKGYSDVSLVCGETGMPSGNNFLLYGRMENIPEELLPKGTPVFTPYQHSNTEFNINTRFIGNRHNLNHR